MHAPAHAPLNASLDVIMTLEEILSVCEARAPTTAEIEMYSKSGGLAVESALNSLALEVARRYASGALGFPECDAVMNNLHSWSLFNRERLLPDQAHQVFLAFDEGEYRHPEDGADVDTEEKYTRSMIMDILRGFDAV